MISLGLSAEEIVKILGSEFGINIALRTFLRNTERVFGGFNAAQEKLLKETIEYFIQLKTSMTSIHLVDANDFVKFVKGLVHTGEKGATSGFWYTDWLLGKVLLDTDYQKIVNNLKGRPSRKVNEQLRYYYSRYYGFTWKHFEYWAMKGVSLETIGRILGVSKTTVGTLYRSRKGIGYNEVQDTTRKRVAVELLARGVDPMTIYTEVWGLAPASPSAIKISFSNLFGMPFEEIMQTNWIPFVEGWVEFYGININ
jgi:hypothetical protein